MESRHRNASALGFAVMVATVLAFVLSRPGDEARSTSTDAPALDPREPFDKRLSTAAIELSAVSDLDELIAEADRLWPPRPEHAVAYRSWMRRAEQLVARLPEQRAVRAELAVLAAQSPETSREEPGVLDPNAQRGAIETGDADAPKEPDALLDKAQEKPAWWRFWDGNAARLISGLEELTEPRTGLLSPDGVSLEHGWSVPRRLAFAEELRSGFAPDGAYTRCWERDLPAIRAAYPGLEIAPQIDLVPIGADRESGLWEFAHLPTGKVPERDAQGRLVLEEAMGIVLVLIPAGSFHMGAQANDPASDNYDPEAVPTEWPVHAVTVSAFFISKYEMSQAQWVHLSGLNPSQYQSGELAPTRLHPVEQVSWLDCMEWLPRVGLTLPSEAQWEYAARARTTTPWWTGAERDSLREKHAANIADGAAARAGARWRQIQKWPELDDGYGVHAPIGTYAANPFGLHEIHGNLWEWCLDGYDPRFYSQGDAHDPVCPWEHVDLRINRGGSYRYGADMARCSYRLAGPPMTIGVNLGVRPARAL